MPPTNAQKDPKCESLFKPLPWSITMNAKNTMNQSEYYECASQHFGKQHSAEIALSAGHDICSPFLDILNRSQVFIITFQLIDKSCHILYRDNEGAIENNDSHQSSSIHVHCHIISSQTHFLNREKLIEMLKAWWFLYFLQTANYNTCRSMPTT